MSETTAYPAGPPLSTATGRAGAPIKVRAVEMAISPDSKEAYVVDANDLDVTPISTATNTPGKPITIRGPGIGLLVPGEQDGRDGP